MDVMKHRIDVNIKIKVTKERDKDVVFLTYGITDLLKNKEIRSGGETQYFGKDAFNFSFIEEFLKEYTIDGYAEEKRRKLEEAEARRTSKFDSIAKYVEVSFYVWEEDSIYSDLKDIRKSDSLDFVIRISDGKIINYPLKIDYLVFEKVVDRGTYTLLDENQNKIIKMNSYVPNKLLPPKDGYGDYVEFKINSEGLITNWFENPKLWEFDDYSRR